MFKRAQGAPALPLKKSLRQSRSGLMASPRPVHTPPLKCYDPGRLDVIHEHRADGRIKAIQVRSPVTAGQLSVTGGLRKPEEALRGTKVGPMLHQSQEATSGQVTCLSIFESTTVPTKSQCRSGDAALFVECLPRTRGALGSRMLWALGSSHSTTKGCL